MSKRTFIFGLLVVLTSLFLLVFSAGAQTGTAEPSPADPAALPAGSGAQQAQHNSQRLVPQMISSWTRIAYQKWVEDPNNPNNSNWEIYVHDSSGTRRLTNTTAFDEYPGLSRGGEYVAFTSTRNEPSGQTNLYKMKADGTGVQLLVRGWAAFPNWSRDGKKLTFQFWVKDRWEVYTADADGSNLKRLTNNAAFDGQPSFSPDGEKIAFVSGRGGGFAVYTMNVDGSDLKKLTTFPNSLHPKWSPDGKSIAFDANVVNDGWQEISVIDSGGSGEKMLYDPGNMATAWVGNWSPDGEQIGFSEILIAQQNGQFVWTDGFLRQYDVAGGSVQEIIPGGEEWYMDWQTLDTQPPVATINPLPEYSAAKNFELEWTGSDTGGAGVRAYDVYYNSSAQGQWIKLLENTKQTSTAFPAQPGTTVKFQVIAIDNAYNVEPWSEQTVVETMFYDTSIGGTVYDNRGTPLDGVTVILDPPAVTPVVSDEHGQFQGYSYAPQARGLTIRPPGFAAMPVTQIPVGADFWQVFGLRPLGSLTNNGTFEANANAPTSWQTGGTLPVAVSAEYKSSGKYGVAFNLPAAVAAGPNVATFGPNAAAAGDATLSQMVTIPSDMQAPTISLMAMSPNDSSADDSGLTVLIKPEGEAEEVVLSPTLTDSWRLYWAPVDKFAGEKVEVILKVTENNGATTVFVDDVALGPGHPELWVSLNSVPRSALTGEIVSFNIEAGNRGGVTAVDGVVELTLDADMTFDSANPPATLAGNVLRWEYPTFPARSGPYIITASVQITGTPATDMLVKARITSDSAEVLLQNNETAILVGNREEHFLPITAR